MMKFLIPFLLLSSLYGCSSYYTSVTKIKGVNVAVTRNDSFFWNLFGSPEVYICKATPEGLTNCNTKENP